MIVKIGLLLNYLKSTSRWRKVLHHTETYWALTKCLENIHSLLNLHKQEGLEVPSSKREPHRRQLNFDTESLPIHCRVSWKGRICKNGYFWDNYINGYNATSSIHWLIASCVTVSGKGDIRQKRISVCANTAVLLAKIGVCDFVSRDVSTQISCSYDFWFNILRV